MVVASQGGPRLGFATGILATTGPTSNANTLTLTRFWFGADFEPAGSSSDLCLTRRSRSPNCYRPCYCWVHGTEPEGRTPGGWNPTKASRHRPLRLCTNSGDVRDAGVTLCSYRPRSNWTPRGREVDCEQPSKPAGRHDVRAWKGLPAEDDWPDPLGTADSGRLVTTANAWVCIPGRL